MSDRQLLAPLRSRPFRFLLSGRTANSLGSAVAPIALAFAVLDLTGSATDLGLVVGARMFALVLFLLFGGAIADRASKPVLMVGASLAAVVTQGMVATLILTHSASIPALIALSAANGVVSALSMPASAALVPEIVPAETRQQANALGRMFFNSAAILGAPLGGIIVATVGAGWGIAVDALMFLVAAACYAAVRPPAAQPESVAVQSASVESASVESASVESASVESASVESASVESASVESASVQSASVEPPPDELVGAAPPERTGILHDLRAGWSEFRGRTWLWVVVAGFCVANASWSGSVTVLGPLVADHTVGRTAWGLVLAADTVGMIVGGLIALRVRTRRFLLYGTVCTAFYVLPVLALGLAPRLAVLLAAGFMAGVGLEQFAVAWETTMQEHVPPEKLARVYSYDMFGSFVAIPIGQVAAGPVAAALGLRTALIGAAALMGLSVVGMLSSRDVRHLRHDLGRSRPAAVEELAA